ncbi:MAG: C4-dicarboxylate transporter permease [Alphaproteobacteria bacterium]|nr:C4-dicarboxylate transporter permease [Alphaproteobacteria bacterium]
MSEAPGIDDHAAPVPTRLATAWDVLILAVAALSIAFHVWVVFGGLVPTLVSRPLHLLFAIPFVFFFTGGNRSRLDIALSWLLGILGIACCLYIALNRRDLADQYGSLKGWFQIALSGLLIAIVLDMARRAVQPVMPAIALIVLLYGLLGQHLPGDIGHNGQPLTSFLGTLVISEGGLWGTLTGTSLELIAPFLILGAFVAAGDAGTGFMAIAQQTAGRFRAGTAKVEVVASALYGTISGSASANVASTGTFTIPAMIRNGYPAPFAASVEAVASTGGQIMPPVMGAGVFLMAEFLRMRYEDLMVVATLPALIFFLTCWFGVDRYAVTLGLRGMSADELPGWRKVARTLPFFALPLGTLIFLFVHTEYTPQFCGILALCVAVALLAIDVDLRLGLRLFLARLREATVNAAQQVAGIAAIMICAGIIVGVFHITGLGVKFTSLIVGLSGGRLWVALILTALACIALGMELPTTAAYAICIAVAGPALIELGLRPLQAHLFVFWYALLCTITPPVCGNVFIAARIAQTPWLPVAWRAMRLGGALFVVPIGFITHPSLLALGSDPLMALLAGAKITLGMALFSYGAIGRNEDWLKRIAALLASAAVIMLYGF